MKNGISEGMVNFIPKLFFFSFKQPSANKRKKETDRLLALKEKLQEEEKRQREHVERVYARLQQVW